MPARWRSILPTATATWRCAAPRWSARGPRTGSVAYAITADSVDPGLVIVFECYEDEAALAEHRKHLQRDMSIPIKALDIWQYETNGRSKLQV